ncbi:gluconate 2-dehydrogenase subunit 3 family protein [Jejuia pallidilutea]|uniref:Gluconate 2-dehydrogenase subunit 3-like protein n=1 Tax=Jejuia pallidilutea TaxID=504487 RepID=A0A090W0S0_9FLAO|nr:gluconate 2-dehydrogenase subunit 3 family protein [Jejuia pallidilutea]GAL70481.1 hypothetical protein JCM19302_1390 [Jejuia pallidilutea]GAL88150.1 hypothetical protein JCM19538_2513 [Jejuia pallidilutea]
MKRREALKNIGLTLGYTAIAPSALSILQSCTSEVKTWTPVFFSKNESIVIKELVNLILPKTETSPGALDVNVPEFLDLYAFKAYDDKRQKTYKAEIDSILNELPTTELGAEALKTEDYTTLLNTYLKPNKTEAAQYRKDKNLTYRALQNLRNQAVWAFTTSETIGKNVLAYDPVPAFQKGCISVNEATGGKAWSL